MQKKSLFLAWILNVIPGLGFFYVGQTAVGILFIIIAVVAGFFMLTGIGIILGAPLYFLAGLISCIASAVLASKYNKQIL